MWGYDFACRSVDKLLGCAPLMLRFAFRRFPLAVARRLPASRSRAWAAVALLAVGAALGGCTPSIGDKCILNTDCSLSGDRQCDTSQPSGYCTVFNCTPNSCPDNAACILFNPAVAGCPYDDRNVSRTAHSFCMAACRSDGDCRSGYVCRDVRQEPWNAFNQDSNQIKTVCIAIPDPALYSAGGDGRPDAEAPVCQADPSIDAAFPELPDAGEPDGDGDGGTDASDSDASDAGAPDANDAGVDASDASDASIDVDAGIPDATVD